MVSILLRQALQLTLTTDESAWWRWALALRVTMPGLFFVYVTAINSTWDDKPKSESSFMLGAPASAGCCSSLSCCGGSCRGVVAEVYLLRTSAQHSPGFINSTGPSRSEKRGGICNPPFEKGGGWKQLKSPGSRPDASTRFYYN